MEKEERIGIVFLYSAWVHYASGILKALRNSSANIEIDVVSWDKKSSNYGRYVIEGIEGVRFHPRSSFTNESLLELLKLKSPKIVYISGWMDKGYMWAVRKYRKEGGKAQVVCGIDDQWNGTVRQYLGRIYFRLFYYKYFDFMWVAGKPQYHYAQRFRYGHERIISNLLSADTSIFCKKAKFSKRFIFVGRFVPEKGLDVLIEAYDLLPESIKREWPLVLIGDGKQKEEILRKKSKHVIIKAFMQPKELVDELLNGGIACVASNHEQWGVAIHEMALLGYPLIISSACGAATEYLISGYNGYLFRQAINNPFTKQ
jgi:glycosyltransferase involved in cell wall biosynthesis